MGRPALKFGSIYECRSKWRAALFIANSFSPFLFLFALHRGCIRVLHFEPTGVVRLTCVAALSCYARAASGHAAEQRDFPSGLAIDGKAPGEPRTSGLTEYRPVGTAVCERCRQWR
jgi:hypothetical protein